MKAKLNYVESTDSGNYNCTVSVGGKIRASVEKKITIGIIIMILVIVLEISEHEI